MIDLRKAKIDLEIYLKIRQSIIFLHKFVKSISVTTNVGLTLGFLAISEPDLVYSQNDTINLIIVALILCLTSTLFLARRRVNKFILVVV